MLELCEAWHHHIMHFGVKKQAIDMQRRFGVDEIGLYNAIKQVKKGFSVCQACNPDNQSHKGEAQWTPIPDQPMKSVAMDLFSMPEVLWLRTAAAQQARKSQVAVAIALQSVNNKEASHANCVNERCKILRSLDRVFVFEIVLCIGAPSKDPARFVVLEF